MTSLICLCMANGPIYQGIKLETAVGGGCPGWKARPTDPAGIGGSLSDECRPDACASKQPFVDGCGLSPRPSRSAGTSGGLLERRRAPLTKETGVVGSRVCTERV